MIHVFGDCELDEARFELRRRGVAVKIEPKTFDVLAYLIKCADRVVSKDELLDAVWPGQSVSESVLPKCVAAARRAVGDAPARPAIIRTVHGRGYRFVALVQRRAAAESPADRTLRPLLAPFVGHAHALARLRFGLESALAGRGRVTLLVGEPGIGKTRTAEELAAEARRRGALVLVGRAYEGEGAPAFWPWLHVLRSGPDTVFGEVRRALDSGAGDRRGATAVDAEQARFRLFDSVAASLRRHAEAQPLVLVLDDLHWADEASLRLFGFLTRDLADVPMLVVATYRDVELRRGHPLGDLLGLLAQAPICERVPLRGFAREDTDRMIAGVVDTPVPDAVAAAVHEMTEGNPFFIQEVARLLASTGGFPDTPATLPLALPQSVRDAVGRRLDALSPECNALLRIAAVLGRDFGAPLLGRVASLSHEQVLGHVADAVRARVLDEIDMVPGRYRFHHSLIRQTLYDELTTPERVDLHARAGAALEAAAGRDVDPVLDELAYHFFQAAPASHVPKAVDYSIRAAERARRLLAYEQSARHYERALQVTELHGAPDQTRRAELILAVGEAHALAGARDRARTAFQRAAEIGRELHHPELLARAALGYRGPGEMGTPADDGATALLEEACVAIGDRHDGLRARLLSRMVGTAPYSLAMTKREAMSREALALARRAGEDAALRDAMEARLWACLGPDHLDERLGVARELLAFGEAEHNPHMALLAHDAQLGTHLIRGDLPAADRALAAFVQIAEGLRQPSFLFFATFYQGSRALAAGELDRAEELFRTAMARGRGTVPYAHFMCTAQLYVLLHMRGDAEDPELTRVFFGEMMALPYSWELAMHCGLAFALYLRGEHDAARREFESVAAHGFDRIRRDEHWLVTLGSLSSTAVLLGDRDRAAQLYALLLPYADLVFVHDLLRSIVGTVAAALGSLATLLGNYDEGERHYEHAHAKETAMGGAVAVMDRVGYARLLLLRNRPGDRARAATLVAELKREMARFGICRNWQLTAIEQLDLRAPAPAARSRGRRIPTKPPRNRQDPGAR